LEVIMPHRMNRLLTLLAAALVLSLGFFSLLSAQESPAGAYDVVITGGRIVDGTGNPWFYGDLAIRGDRIARITPAGLLADAPARERIDARGLVVAPGFIDIQSHSRYAFLEGDGRAISKITQGVTTEILGEGSTNAPSKEFNGPRGFNAWLEAMQQHGTAPNFGSFLGATTVRMHVKGMAEGPATPDELKKMRVLVKNAMEDGAFGLATALIYPPGSFATTEELIEVAKAMAPYGGVYITHLRSEADQYLQAIDEALRIGREAGVPVEIYHLKAGGRRNWSKAPLAIARINAARAEGQDVQANMYPYVAGGTGLSACLPPWASADGKLLENLSDPATRGRIRADVLEPTTEWENLCALSTPEGVLVLGLDKPENKPLVGLRLSEIAARRGQDWVEAAMDLVLSEEDRVGSIFFMMSEENVQLQMRQPWIKFGTDASGWNPAAAGAPVHPRAYGTYPRILGKYVREEQVMTLEEAVRKMSAAVAERLSIQDRGLLREGLYADVVVFNPDTVADHATFEQPHQLSTGIEYVFVNGTAVVREGKPTGSKPGRIVRGPGYRKQ
jgi:N-acyl-D-amino-acid deacylase